VRRIAFLARLVLLLASLAAGAARADDIEVRGVALRATGEGLMLDADFAFELTPRLAEVVANGVPIYFRVEFELIRRRWYWFDDTTAVRRLQVRLSYHALSRQYRLSTGLLQQNFSTLEEALTKRAWLASDQYSLADVNGFNLAYALPLSQPDLANDEKTPHIMEWLRKIYERPATRHIWSMGRTPMVARVKILEREHQP